MVPPRWTRNVFTLVPSGGTVPVNVSGIVGGAGVGVVGGVGSLHADALSARPSTDGENGLHRLHMIPAHCTVRMTLPKWESVPTAPLTPIA